MITSKIKERLYRRQHIFSFEFFPPKTDKGLESLRKALAELAELSPDFVSVTYGAGGSTRERTKDLVCSIQKDFGLTTMAHLTCIGHSNEEIRALLADFASAGIRDILALRGDPPRGSSGWDLVMGGPEHAIDLVRMAKSMGVFNIACAGFPEVHPEAKDMDEDVHYLKEKTDAGAELVITQLFFDNEAYFDYLRKSRKAGIDIPIIPGVMPITKFEQIERFVELSGCYIPQVLKEHLEKHKDDAVRVEEIGLAYCAAQCVDLLRRGAPGIHFYTLNQSRACQTIFSALQAMGFWNV
ncbi:MAG: methylenetetrahydrofolate reductase [NAD(P)H] [Planctomycetes bacterium]|nr:methylenetetrahydrofolate reductase [NAD(P)H] [Planctomycetota bacterium]